MGIWKYCFINTYINFVGFVLLLFVGIFSTNIAEKIWLPILSIGIFLSAACYIFVGIPIGYYVWNYGIVPIVSMCYHFWF